MRAEVSIAVNFVLSFLYNRLPRRRVNLFGEQLDCSLMAKFQGHWYPDQPVKGTAFRCLKISGEQSDPILLDAARETGLDLAELMKHLPQNLTLWIDPGEVSCRVGEKGPVTQLYFSENAAAEAESPVQPQLMPSLPEPLWTYQQLQLQGGYTAADFALTKFGSTKLRQPPRSHSGRQNLHLTRSATHQQFQQRQQQQQQQQHWGMPWGLQGPHWLWQPQQQRQQQQQQQQQFTSDFGGSDIWSCDGLSIAIPSPASMATPSAGSAGTSAESSGHSSPQLMMSK